MPSPSDLMIATLQVKVAALEVAVAALQKQMHRAPTAHEVVAAERADLYDRIERAIYDEFELDVMDGQSLSPAEILATLKASGEQVDTYGATDHARKVTLGKVLKRMGVRRGADADGRLYAMRRK